MGHVEVTHHQGMVAVLCQLRKAGAHDVQKAELVILFWGPYLTGVHISAGNGELDGIPCSVGDAEVSFHPSSCGGEVLITDAVPGCQRFLAGGNGDAGTAFCFRLGMQDVPVLTQQLPDDGVRSADFLQAEDVHFARLQPGRHSVFVGSPEAVYVNGCDAKVVLLQCRAHPLHSSR